MLCALRSPLFFALGALALLLVAMEAWRPGFFLHDDNASWFAGAYALDFRTLTQSGQLAEVNFYQYGGEPFVGQGQTAVLYPLVYIAGALAWLVTGDLRWTVDWLAALHLALAVAGFYAWARRGGVEAWTAALGGLVWALNPFVLILGASWIVVTAAAAWLPWLFWGIDGVFAAKASRTGGSPSLQECGLRGMALGVIAGMFVLQGYVQFAAYAFLFAGMYGAYLLFLGWVGRREGDAESGCEESPMASCALRAPGQQVVRATGDGEPELSSHESTSPVHGVPGLPIVAGTTVNGGSLPSPSPGGRRLPLQALASLVLAGLMALAISLPQILPLVRAAGESKARAQELSPMFELFYRADPGDLLWAQLGFFRQHFLFDASTALFFCPALLLLPLAVVRFARGDAAQRRRLFPLILLAGMALVFSGRGYFLLNVLPLMQKFRWPFKVFLFAEFFLIAALVWSCASWMRRVGLAGAGEANEVRTLPVASCASTEVSVEAPGQQVVRATSDCGTGLDSRTLPSPVPGDHGLPQRRGLRWGLALLALVLVLQVSVALAEHDSNFLSAATLPARADLPAGIDPTLGRVITIGHDLPVATAYQHLTHAYATYYEVPSLGGYDPLVSKASLEFALGLDVPNFYDQPVTLGLLAASESRAVRYWVVDADAVSLLTDGGALDGLRGFKILGPGWQFRFPQPAPPITAGSQLTPPWAGQRIESKDPLDRNRLIFEDTLAQPMAFATATPTVALPLRYVGNSMLIGLSGAAGQIAVSVGPTDGWWCRVDGGRWERADYHDFRLYIDVAEKSRELEIRYFDPQLRLGVRYSLIIIGLLLLFGCIRWWVARRR